MSDGSVEASSPWQAPGPSTPAHRTGFKAMGLLSGLLIAQQTLIALTSTTIWVGNVIQPQLLEPDYTAVGTVDALLTILLLTAMMGQISLILLGLPIWIGWHVRAGGNTHALGHADLRFSPRSHAWWWFVPVANLLMPLNAMQELLRTSVAPDSESYGTLPSTTVLWWGSYLISATMAAVSTQAGAPGSAETVNGLYLMSGPLNLVGMGLYISFVRTVWIGQTKQAVDRERP